MRRFALALLILIAAPTIAWGDLADELECKILLERGNGCVESVWIEHTPEGKKVVRGPVHECVAHFSKIREEKGAAGRIYPEAACRQDCNRRAYQDFGIGERIKYHWCKARY